MKVAEGMLTELGGMTSHAAVVARGMGVCAITGCDALRIDTARAPRPPRTAR
jgi:pyruvate,orthophosphate dikinase